MQLGPHDDLPRAIDRAPDGAVLYLAAGTYAPAGPLRIRRRLTLVGAGWEITTLEGWVELAPGAHLTLEGLHLAYAGPGPGDALSARDAHLDASDCAFSGARRGLRLPTHWPRGAGTPELVLGTYRGGRGVRLRGAGTARFTDCHFLRNQGSGLEATDRAQVELAGCRCVANGEHGLSLSDYARATAAGLVARGNAYQGAAALGRSRLELTGGELGANGRNGLFVGQRAAVTATALALAGNAHHGLMAIGAANVALEGCALVRNAWRGAWIRRIAHVVAHRCRMEHNALDGLSVGDLAWASVSDSSVGHNGCCGLGWYARARGEATANRCERNGSDGLHVSDRAQVRLSANESLANEGHGLFIGFRSRVAAAGNLCERNLRGGIWVVEAARAHLEGNRLVANRWRPLAFARFASGSARGNVLVGTRGTYVSVSGRCRVKLAGNVGVAPGPRLRLALGPELMPLAAALADGLTAMRVDLAVELGLVLAEGVIEPVPEPGYRLYLGDRLVFGGEVAAPDLDLLTVSLARDLRRHAADLLEAEDVALLLRNLGVRAPSTLAAWRRAGVSPEVLGDVLRGLLREGCSIRRLEPIVGLVAEGGVELVEGCRRLQGRWLCQALAGDDQRVPAMTLAPELEAQLLQHPDACEDPFLRAALAAACERYAGVGFVPVLVCHPRLRPALAAVVPAGAHVLSTAELVPPFGLQALDAITLGHEPTTLTGQSRV
ncbi:MAG: flhA [Cyanobacteria bacterium RYN_339]|nr:flhA [Cyanobacteria bacterium RYN_339]